MVLGWANHALLPSLISGTFLRYFLNIVINDMVNRRQGESACTVYL
jgi:hypothetical protein